MNSNKRISSYVIGISFRFILRFISALLPSFSIRSILCFVSTLLSNFSIFSSLVVFSYFIGISFLFTLPLISALLCSFSTITSVRSRLIFPIFGRRIPGKNERGVSFILFLLLFLEKVRPEVAYRLHVPASQISFDNSETQMKKRRHAGSRLLSSIVFLV